MQKWRCFEKCGCLNPYVPSEDSTRDSIKRAEEDDNLFSRSDVFDDENSFLDFHKKLALEREESKRQYRLPSTERLEEHELTPIRKAIRKWLSKKIK
jgi:hypothetical protein